jgi:hypothetical protein
MDSRSQARHVQLLEGGHSRKGSISEVGNTEQAFSRIARIYREGTTGKTDYTKWQET